MEQQEIQNPTDILVVIGLGNPGHKYRNNRHNIGFLVLDALAETYGLDWQSKDKAEIAQLVVGSKTVMLVKPQTFMNVSGLVVPALTKKGIKPENILVVHDELEKPFGTFAIRCGGSARGHNGLKSIIKACGFEFWLLRCGVGRPENKNDVPEYVLTDFAEERTRVAQFIQQGAAEVEKYL